MESIKQLVNFLSQSSSEPSIWLTQVFAVVLITVSCNYVLMRLLDMVKKRVEQTESLWDDALLQAARIPLRLFVWTLGLTFALRVLDRVTESVVFSVWPEVRHISYIFIVAMFFTRFIRYAELNIVDVNRSQKPVDETTARAVAKLLRVSVIVTAFLVMLQTLGYSISGVLAFGGMGGVAVGFAAKDMLANFFGGLMIYLDKPFAVGDWVRSPDREIEGTVEDIGWRLTRILTFDKRPLFIPNSMFSSIVVENPSRMLNRRISETIGIRYDDGAVLQAIVNDIRAMLKQHPAIDQGATQIVHFNGYGASQLDIMVYAFTKTTEWVKFHADKEDVLLQIMAIVGRHGAEFAFPTQTLHLASQPTAQAMGGGV